MSLDNYRKKIDEIDDKIILLLEKRLLIAKKTIKHKKKTYDPKREEFILSKIKSPYIKNIYKEIFKNSKKLQKEISDI